MFDNKSIMTDGMISGTEMADQLKAGATRVADRDVDPEKAFANMETAMGLVNTKIGHITDLLTLQNLHFKFFEGDIVGESLDSGEVVMDPIMLMHPAMRMAYALAHELFHQNKKVRNEALVDAMARIYFPAGVMESVYDSKKMIDFAATAGIKVEDLYKMYFKGQYDEMFNMYTEGYAKIHGPNEQNMEVALQGFRALFPELNYVDEPAVWDRTRPEVDDMIESAVQ